MTINVEELLLDAVKHTTPPQKVRVRKAVSDNVYFSVRTMSPKHFKRVIESSSNIASRLKLDNQQAAELEAHLMKMMNTVLEEFGTTSGPTPKI